MKKVYKVRIQGTNETAERAVRLLDRVFRWRYNVYGVRRSGSGFDAEAQEYYIEVLLIADWIDHPRMIYLFPEFLPENIIKNWYYLMAKEHELDDLYVGELTEIEGEA